MSFLGILPCVIVLAWFNIVNAMDSVLITKTNYYSLRNSVRYGQASIIEQLEKASKVYCLLECDRVRGCKHIAFHKDINHCHLLKEDLTVEEGPMTDADGIEMYSLGKLLQKS